MKFSKTTGCFYPNDLQYTSLPTDLIDISQPDYELAMARQPGDTLDVVDGAPVVVPAPAPTAAAVIAATAAAMTAAVQAHMDTQARTHGYDTLLSAISYADEPAVPSYQADGQAFRAWRSLVWAKCHELLAQVQAGTRPLPSEAALISLLPQVVR